MGAELKPFHVTEEPLDGAPYMDYVTHPGAGAVTLFAGTVREWTNGKRTMYLKYEAYVPMAEKKLAQIGDEIIEKWPGSRVAIVHRIGELAISDIAVIIAVSSPHRRAAYEANEYAIEQIKKVVPIWKKEIWEDGEEWIGDQAYKPEGGKA
ncbi:molybdenum cofactor biosynthesis protein MoaE [Domibacillus sp. DTU_2020_1001157_1_SI_ALB_TIR_016]|uniref:molybdenum cofactor biosynthesis protein MoaE n=1 Tax=Domibacillus sp. DTU_2020_1001157_1_SI_ALB_TIR_016 TaxID=3077789 RepID=UPI0028E546C2|nr:molybdenum cofactor biosynthesis protein MoaE [Domibacillus sp. DTU_2020_1001157_1_SI_ALB_TIR_016]WNS80491.1 molybdenum cofactor biosynthesis protein MoaE [Domibacillus sp. DTU_2020_1001157_1_SI_ALB_TIR_016]